MAIELKTPVVTPEIESETFNEIWLSRLVVQAFNPNEPVKVNAVLSPAKSVADGKELNHASDICLNIEDFFATATQAEMVVMYNLINLLKARANV